MRISPRTIGQDKDGFRIDLNGLRALAVASVILFHFHVPGFSGGFIGVDIFFVISGFLITKSLVGRHGAHPIRDFYAARVVRILPALMAMVAIVLLWGWLRVDPIAYQDMATQSASALLFVSNILFLAENPYFGPAASGVWMLHTWSLSVEWQFYLVYPLLFSALLPRLGFSLQTCLVVLFLLSLGLYASADLLGGPNLKSSVFYFMPTRAWEILLGALLFLSPSIGASLASVAAEAAGLVLIALSVLMFRDDGSMPNAFMLIPTAGTALVIAAARGRSTLLRSAPFQCVGLWSYSIYLWHWPLLVATRYADAGSVPVYAAGIASALLLGWASDRWIERPSAALMRRSGGGRILFWSIGGGLLLLLLATIGINGSDGAAGRVPGARRAIVADAAAAREDWTFPAATCNGLTGERPKICRLGPAGPARILVIGDSHAQMWYPRFAKLAAGRNIPTDIVSMAGCPPVPGMSKIGRDDCTRFNRAVAALIARSSYSRVVILAAWVDYLDYRSAINKACLDMGGECRRIDTIEDRQAAQAAIAGTIASIARDAQVVIVLPTPRFAFNVPEQMAKTAFEGGDLTHYRAEPINREGDGVTAFLNGLASDRVQIVDAGPLLCDRSECHVLDSGSRIMLKDNNHIRASVAREATTIDATFDAIPPPR